jgi:hypothetical protein
MVALALGLYVLAQFEQKLAARRRSCGGGALRVVALQRMSAGTLIQKSASE